MSSISSDQVKALREKTGISVMRVQKALQEAEGDEQKAIEILKSLGEEVAAKKGDRTLGAGIIESYVHHDKSVGVLLLLAAETDFVAKNEEFAQAAHSIALHIAASSAETVEELLKEDFLQDTSKTIDDVVKGLTAKFGENASIENFVRMRA